MCFYLMNKFSFAMYILHIKEMGVIYVSNCILFSVLTQALIYGLIHIIKPNVLSQK